MISPLKIGLQGLAPGSSPIEIGTQGFIISITPPVEEADQDLGGGYAFMPVRWTSPRTRQDCRIEVQGCRATLTATDQNIAKNNFTTEDEDRLDDYIFAAEYNARIEAEQEEKKQLYYLERLRWVTEALKQRSERRSFRKTVTSIAEDIRSQKNPHEDIVALIVGLSQQGAKMLARLQEMEAKLELVKQATPAKTKPAKRKK